MIRNRPQVNVKKEVYEAVELALCVGCGVSTWKSSYTHGLAVNKHTPGI